MSKYGEPWRDIDVPLLASLHPERIKACVNALAGKRPERLDPLIRDAKLVCALLAKMTTESSVSPAIKLLLSAANRILGKSLQLLEDEP